MATGATPIVRFIGQTDVDANEPFWRKWVGPVTRWLAAGLEPIVFLHTPDNADAPALARTFHAAVAEAAGDLDPLLEPPARGGPVQPLVTAAVERRPVSDCGGGCAGFS